MIKTGLPIGTDTALYDFVEYETMLWLEHKAVFLISGSILQADKSMRQKIPLTIFFIFDSGVIALGVIPLLYTLFQRL